MTYKQKCTLIIAVMFLLPSLLHYAGASQTGINGQAGQLLDVIDLGDDIDIHSVSLKNQELTVCLDMDTGTLSDENGLAVENLSEVVRVAVTPLEWRSLFVQVYDTQTRQCRPLADFLPPWRPTTYNPEYVVQAGDGFARSATGAAGSLSGKTVYISAGHGWHWTSYGWRTQRVVYQGFIEDHNNAEVVDQYLIPYLENAGAKVVPMRERDWNATRLIADNDGLAGTYQETGSWTTSESTGYKGLSYRWALTVNNAPTATATWHLTAASSGEYAVYAWFKPGGNRAPDAHYVIQHAGGQDSVTLDQRSGPETWRYLGTYPFYAGPITVTLDNKSNLSGAAVIADAIRVGGGLFDTLDGIYETASAPPYPSTAPNEPYWESAAYYYSQWMGMDPNIWSYFNDVISRPLFTRWNHAGTGEDAIYLSWHTNGHDGTARGTVSYVFQNDLEEYPNCVRTAGSVELQSAVHNELIHDIRAGWDANWQDRGKRQADLGEVRMLCEDDPNESEIPGVLLEIAFHDNPDDANALKDPRFNQLSARAVYQGIVNYFEGRDGANLTMLPEPPTHFRVTNNGSGQLTVSWLPGSSDGGGLYGDAATSYRVYVSPDGFAWGTPMQVTQPSHVISNLALDDVVYVKVTAVNAGGESFPTEVLGAGVGDPQILIVNGFDDLTRFGLVSEYDQKMNASNLRMWLDQINAQNYVLHHGEAVDTFSGWDSTSNEAVVDSLINMRNYGAVDWILGEESTLGEGSLSSAERAAISAYLSDGRGLLISGSELGWDMEHIGLDPAFLHDTLHTDYVADDAQTYTVQPAQGGIFEGLSDFSFDAPGEYDANFPDVIAPLNGAVTSLNYVGGVGGTAAIQYADTARRLVVMGFPFEVIQPAKRLAVMNAILDFLGILVTDTIVDSPTDGGYINTTPSLYGRAVGKGLTRVDIQVQDLTSHLFWDGTSWGGTGWITATGINPWSDTLPMLAEGPYAIKARAVGEMVDPTPAEAAFTIDTTAPYTPTSVFPVDNTIQTSPVVTFQWEAPLGDASPLHYRLVIDNAEQDVSGEFFTTALHNGFHTWLVYAIDAAGNRGPSTRTTWFYINSNLFYLPVVIHHGSQ